ncbi:MAG: hypothetical protein M3Z04_17910 [Chloroflexota bacterium]|nr:hypothetical protein [Chloroflexota bacterium]
MAKRDQLRQLRLGTVVNPTSSKQERDVTEARKSILPIVAEEYKLHLDWRREIRLRYIIEDLQRKGYSDFDPNTVLDSTSMLPDGGILSLVDADNHLYPILIVEVKSQGTNTQRLAEGKPKQARGNAIERLGKNVIGFRTWLLPEAIFPFVCFGSGDDFAEHSPIVDRVKTINQFGPLNTFAVDRTGPHGEFQRGCFYFREASWTVTEMAALMLPIMRHSINYYRAKYPDTVFRPLG